MARPNKGLHPPRIAFKILSGLLDPSYRDFFLGDLLERFREIASERSSTVARLWYWKQTLLALLSLRRNVFGRTPPSGATRELREASRNLWRHPLFSMGIILILALGIGAVGTAFSVLHGTILRGLPFPEAHRLVHFERSNLVEGLQSMAVTPHDYEAWKEAQSSFEGLGAYVEATALIPQEGMPPSRHEGVFISANSFSLLGVGPSMGRPFTAADESPSSPAVVILSGGLWGSRFGSDPTIVGKEVILNGSPTTVVGVMPEGFGFPVAEEFWLPLQLDFTTILRGEGRLDVFGRLRPGVDLQMAREDFLRITTSLESAYPETNANVQAEMKRFREEYIGEEFQGTVWKMFSGSLLVLLICCANVANLLLLRGIRREGDLALRSALGASRVALIRLLLWEGLFLAVGGSVLGFGLVHLGVGWFNTVGAQAGVFSLPHGPASLFWWQVSPDPVTLFVVILAAGGTGVAVSLLPALTVTGRGAAPCLKEGGRTSLGRRHSRLASGLVIAQVALTTGLSVAGALTLRSVWNVAEANDILRTPEEIITARVDLPAASAGVSEGAYPDLESRVRFAELLKEALEARPEVVAAAVATDLPLSRPRLIPITVDGIPHPDPAPLVGAVTISSGYFEALGLEPSVGRLLVPGDRQGSEPVALVNESLARRLLPGKDPLGIRFRLGTLDEADVWYKIVGVVPDLWDSNNDPSREAGVYLPLGQSVEGTPAVRLGWQSLRFQSVILKGRPGLTVNATTLRDAVFRLDTSLPLTRIQSMREVASARSGRFRVWGRFYLVFALVGLLLAGIGVFGVLASEVAARAPEIALRKALGATTGTVRSEVLKASAMRVGWGGGLGLFLGWTLGRGLESILYSVEALDPTVYLSALLAVALVAATASWVPAVWATRLDPVDALKG